MADDLASEAALLAAAPAGPGSTAWQQAVAAFAADRLANTLWRRIQSAGIGWPDGRRPHGPAPLHAAHSEGDAVEFFFDELYRLQNHLLEAGLPPTYDTARGSVAVFLTGLTRHRIIDWLADRHPYLGPATDATQLAADSGHIALPQLHLAEDAGVGERPLDLAGIQLAPLLDWDRPVESALRQRLEGGALAHSWDVLMKAHAAAAAIWAEARRDLSQARLRARSPGVAQRLQHKIDAGDVRSLLCPLDREAVAKLLGCSADNAYQLRLRYRKQLEAGRIIAGASGSWDDQAADQTIKEDASA